MHALIIGAGGIGSHTAAALTRAGHTVTLASRSGAGPTYGRSASEHDATSITTTALDAAEPGAITAAARGADVIVNALNPPYTRWATDWPPLAAAFLDAAATNRAGLVTVGNLYPHGHVDAPITEGSPIAPNGTKGMVRAKMWADALAAHERGEITAVEVRASDYFGPGASRGTSYLNEYVIAPAAKGATPRPPIGRADAPHSWAYLPDIGALVAAIAQSDQHGPDWGRTWHVPSPEPRTMQEVAGDVAAAVGTGPRAVRPWPAWLRSSLKIFVPILRELDETAHQFERPFVIDGSAAETRFGLTATAWPEALRATLGAIEAPSLRPAAKQNSLT